jgi:hypothetical protein
MVDKMQSLNSDFTSEDYKDDNSSNSSIIPAGDLNLLDIVARILDKGMVINGDISIFIAGAELLTLRINLVIASLETAKRYGIQLPWENWNNGNVSFNRETGNLGTRDPPGTSSGYYTSGHPRGTLSNNLPQNYEFENAVKERANGKGRGRKGDNVNNATNGTRKGNERRVVRTNGVSGDKRTHNLQRR